MPADFSAFNLFTNMYSPTGWSGWSRNGPALPTLVINTSSSTQEGISPGQLNFHGDNGNLSSALRWTAPSSGQYTVAGQFTAGNTGVMSIGVRQGSSWLWQGTDSGSFNLSVTATTGDAIDFVVYASNVWSGATGLDVTITRSQ
jgi:hypothetical protein